ncbi:uracil DNA glycosylase [Collariella sp. IMI 366227]|nr:uracil DNA glycosylase [Collariella sp. IMI 366227]
MSTLKRKAAAEAGAEPKKAKQANIMSFFGAPKATASAGSASKSAAAAPAAAAPEPPALKFDKAKWVATLTPEQKKLLKLEIDTLHESWLVHLKDELVTKEFLELKRFLDRETAAGKKWFPPAEDVYSCARPGLLAGLLTRWADRGVLLLNTCLTVRAHEANSHSNRGWERFTQKVIDLVAAKRTRVKRVEAVVKASAAGGNTGKGKEVVVEKKEAVKKVKSEEGDENEAPEIEA